MLGFWPLSPGHILCPISFAEGLRRRYQVRLEHGHVNVNGPEGQSTFSLRGDDDSAVSSFGLAKWVIALKIGK